MMKNKILTKVPTKNNIAIEEITFSKFPFLLGRRIGFLVLKLAGSRTMLSTLVVYLNAIALMWVFATKELSVETMKGLIILYLIAALFVSVVLGFIKFEPIKTEVKLQK